MERKLNALQILIIVLILFGAFAIQIFMHEQPCSLCLLQRLGMLGVATGAYFNCRFGVKSSHYGLSLLSAIFGSSVALRQIALHICPGMPTYGLPFWGLSLYTWSFLIFASSIGYAAFLMLIFAGTKKEDPTQYWWVHTVFALLLLATLSNAAYTFYDCGLGVCE